MPAVFVGRVVVVRGANVVHNLRRVDLAPGGAARSDEGVRRWMTSSPDASSS